MQLLNPYNLQNFDGDKLSILDIKAKCFTGKQYNIEMQINDIVGYKRRALYYWSKLYADQLMKSQNYNDLNKTIGIHILNFTIIPELEEYHNRFRLYDDRYKKVNCLGDIEFHFIELSKFENNQRDGYLNEQDELKLLLSKVKTSLDRWVAFLSRAELLSGKKLPKEIDDPQVQKALNVLEVMNFNLKEREAYEDGLKIMRDEWCFAKKV